MEYSNLKSQIDAVIKTNGNREITGAVMNDILNLMVNSLGRKYQFFGVVTPSTPVSPSDERMAFIAWEQGVYPYLNNYEVGENEIAVITWDNVWNISKINVGADFTNYYTKGQVDALLNALGARVSALDTNLTKYKQTVENTYEAKDVLNLKVLVVDETTLIDDWQSSLEDLSNNHGLILVKGEDGEGYSAHIFPSTRGANKWLYENQEGWRIADVSGFEVGVDTTFADLLAYMDDHSFAIGEGGSDVTKEYVDGLVGAERERAEGVEDNKQDKLSDTQIANINAVPGKADKSEVTALQGVVAGKQDTISDLDEIRENALKVLDKMERVELLYHHDTNTITLMGDDTPLTFEQIASYVEDTTKFVTMYGYDGEFLLPQYYDGGALTFTGLTIFADYTASHRVIINLDEEIKSEVFDLVRKDYVDDNFQTKLTEAQIANIAAVPGKASQSELTELSLKVGELETSKQDTLTPGSGITIEDNVISATGGGESGKRGVISQTQTWVGTTNVYTLTDIVYGNIPFEAIDNYTMCYAEFLDMDGNLYTKNGVSTPTLEADGTLKRTTPWGEVIYQQKGYFYLNGIADLSYYDMRLIYNEAKGDIMWTTLPSLSATKARTHISFTRYGGTGDSGYYRCAYNYIFVTSEMLEVINVQMDNIRTDTRRQFTGGTVFTNLYHLRHIVGLIECTTPGNVFQNARLLESLTLTRLNASISFRWTPYLTRESIRYMIDNAINTSAITITLHADAYARLNDEDKAAATAKNINLVIA